MTPLPVDCKLRRYDTDSPLRPIRDRHSFHAVNRRVALVLTLLLVGCAPPVEEGANDRPGFSQNGRRDLIGLDVDTKGVKAGRRYIEYATNRDFRGPGTAYADYGCTGDCSDIRAGYQAAKARNVTNSRECTAETWGEMEGCVAFTQHLKPETTELPPLDHE